jgi:hypothetical protein
MSTEQIQEKPHGAAAGDVKSPLQDQTLPSAVNNEAVLPKGTLDPVYEAKAKILNDAVRSLPRVPTEAPAKLTMSTLYRFKTLAWDGTNGSFLSLSASVFLLVDAY